MYTMFKTHKIQVFFFYRNVGYLQSCFVKKPLSTKERLRTMSMHYSSLYIFSFFGSCFFGFLCPLSHTLRR